jgi:hypothetical protein
MTGAEPGAERGAGCLTKPSFDRQENQSSERYGE